jgi:hypothetical protein
MLSGLVFAPNGFRRDAYMISLLGDVRGAGVEQKVS